MIALLRERPGLCAGLVLSLALLLAHAWVYRFQCDDAYISFRYARNLAHGAGLVFNPGGERVEGYTNFLWVLVLAAAARLGIPPERAANPLSLLATIALWALTAWFAVRRDGKVTWLVLLPLFLLAGTRSVAVWSTSGLETRWFEVFLLAAVLRLVVEVERMLAGDPTPAAAAGPLFALASLTRPDGLIASLSAMGAAAVLLANRGRLARRWSLRTILPFVALVGGQYLFRRAYYGDWLPNTYYAKIDGRLWWSAGRAYLVAFGLEYAIWLWFPLVVLGVVQNVRRGRLAIPLLFASATIPHAIYVAAIGGDHFEYRPLDAYFPFAYLLLAWGFTSWARGAPRTAVAVALAALIAIGIWELPAQSHRQFPARYVAGFPGMSLASGTDAEAYLAPERDPVYRWPGLRRFALAYQERIRYLTRRYVGVRQEEHRLFFESASRQASRLRGLIERGVLPRDLYVAVSCVGVIPYVTDLRTLDRHGLTDAHVAHSPPAMTEIMAHGKVATLDYARSRGVDVWAVDPVHLVVPVTSNRLLVATRESGEPGAEAYAAVLGDDQYLLCVLPQGLERTASRLPQLQLRPTLDPRFILEYIARAIEVTAQRLRADPSNFDDWRRLAMLTLGQGRIAEAKQLYEHLAQVLPTDGAVWENLALCDTQLGDAPGALAALQRALELARAEGSPDDERRLVGRIDEVERSAAGRNPRR